MPLLNMSFSKSARATLITGWRRARVKVCAPFAVPSDPMVLALWNCGSRKRFTDGRTLAVWNSVAGFDEHHWL